MKYTLRQLGYFVAAAETGSITLASQRTHISPPAISTAIAHIERELAIQLFLRHHAQGLSLTPAGRLLLRDAKQLLKQAEGLQAAAASLSHPLRGELTIGWFATLAPLVMPELLREFLGAYPEIRVRSIVAHQEGLLESLRRAETEVAITYDVRVSEDIDFQPLAVLAPYALFGERHPLAKARSVKLAELEPLPMVLLDMPLSRDYFMALFIQERLKPNIAWSFADLEVVRSMVANGHGYTLSNARPRAEVAIDGRRLYRVPLAGSHPPVRIGIATLKELQQTRLVETFRRHCQETICERYIPGMAPAARPSRRAPA